MAAQNKLNRGFTLIRTSLRENLVSVQQGFTLIRTRLRRNLAANSSVRTRLRRNLVSSQQGFTLIELLIVIAVISGLASIFVATYPGAQRKARDAERQSDIKQYQTALETYANSNNGLYPDSSGTTQLTNVCSANLNVPNCPDDPRSPPNPSYSYNGVPTEYVAWAQLELSDDAGNIQYFVTCSNGLSDTTTTQPTSSTCPL